jgi:pimeloyl-ACP methyl ester carboxylesterase
MVTSNPTSTVVETAHGAVEYADLGTGAPVLFVHGSPGGWDQGELMSRFLVAGGFRVIAPSRPGYVATPLTDTNGTADGTAELLLALMDHVGIERFAIMCWSGGGPSTYRIAATNPARVAAIVACAAVSKPYEFARGLASIENSLLMSGLGRWLMHEMAEHTPKSLVKSTLGEEGKLSKGDAAALVEHVWEQPEKREFVLELSATISGRKAGLKNDHERFPDLPDLELGTIEAPVLLVHGTVDTDVPPSYSDSAQAQLPVADLLPVENGTHLAVWTDPRSDDVQGRIASHLRR